MACLAVNLADPPILGDVWEMFGIAGGAGWASNGDIFRGPPMTSSNTCSDRPRAQVRCQCPST